jgi:chloramphenicol O-acetyltransferase
MNPMNLLERYEALPLQRRDISGSYQAWALDYFTNPELVPDPYIDITVQLDISPAVSLWQERLSAGKGSLTAWLTWNLLQSLHEFPCFQWRFIEGQWFEVQNPPLFCPVAAETNDRFVNMVMENPFRMSWQEFEACWFDLKQRLLTEGRFDAGDASVFGFSHFIGNLPNLHFSSLVMHQPASLAGIFSISVPGAVMQAVPSSCRWQRSSTMAPAIPTCLSTCCGIISSAA